MEKTVEILLTDKLLLELFDKFSLRKNNFKKLGDFESYVYEVSHGETAKILRLTHSSHRNVGDIEAELDWMNFLYENGVNVPQPFESNQDNLVEEIQVEDGSYFYACVFSKASGRPVKINSPEFNPDLFYAWGKEMGKMHFVTKRYILKGNLKRRQNWDEEELLDLGKYIPSNETILVEKTQELIAEIRNLPSNKNNFGLIHTDMHSGNFFFDGKEIHVFDFDDSAYNWFASDIAIPLYYSILYGNNDKSKTEIRDFAKRFITAFMEGYQTENSLPEQWKEHLQYFLRLRDITLYSVLHKKIAPEDRDERLLASMEQMSNRIKNEEAIVNI